MKRTLIIAEAGVNHNGSLELAKKLVDSAKIAEVDFVKFQVCIPNLVASKFAEKADYQKRSTGAEESQLEMIRKISLTFEEHKELKSYCDTVGVNYLCTPFDLPSIEFLNTLDLPFWKIPSGEITNYPYLKAIGLTLKTVILSTGMATIQEIEEAINLLQKFGTQQIIILHCTTEYPAPKNEVNLRAIETLRKRFDCEVGYSDHTQGIEIPVAAVALGAVVIEKHFTLNRSMEGPDHKASLEPNELKLMVEQIRNVELSLGSGVKEPSSSEIPNIAIARKSIVAAKNISSGEIYTEYNLITKRPGNGISPMLWEKIIGTKAPRDFFADEPIEY